MILEFKQFLYEASIDEFMGKIASCHTLEGLEELEAYYKKRIKETELKDTDDISGPDVVSERAREGGVHRFRGALRA